jgi:serine/threonine protein kinase
MPELEGKVLEGKYRLARKLGSGGVGTVYEATHVVIGQKFAIKILKPEFAGSPTLALRLVQEAKSASAVDHPSIIKVFDAGRTKDGLTFLVMELLHGEELAAHIRARAPFDPDEAVDITCDVLEALVAAHQRGIIHRDLKPENVFLTRGPRGQRWTKLLDFGIAKVVDHKLGAPRLTHAGTVVGTPFYMAPEHARGARDLDARVDVYATGVMLYEMLTKRVPYDGASYNEVLAKVLSDPFPRPSQFNRFIPEGLEALILRATAKDRDARFPTAKAFLEALEPFRPETPSSVIKLEDAERAMRGKRVASQDLEMLPEESVPTMVEDARGASRPPSIPPPEGELTVDGLPGAADRAFDSATGRASGAPRGSAVASAQTLRLSGDDLQPREGGLREAGTLAGSLVSVERISRQRLTVLAALGLAALATVAVVLWLVWRGNSTSEAVPPAAVESASAAPADAGGTVPPPGGPLDAGGGSPALAPVAPDVVASAPDASAAGPAEPSGDAASDVGTFVAIYDVPPLDGQPPTPDDGKVTVQIIGAPATAKIFVDGDHVANPFRLPPSEGQHKLRIVAPGYRPYATVFHATSDFAIAVRMYRERSGGSATADAGAARDVRSGQLQPNPFLTPSP